MNHSPIGRRSLLAGSAALAAALPFHASAQTWPSRTLRLIVPFPPGGSNDVLARALAEDLSPLLGQPVVVENRGGAGGAIGAEVVARAAPDGHTLLFVSSSLTTSAAVQKLPYDPVRDFTPIVQAAVAPMIVTVGRDFPARTMQDLIRIARERPGQLRFGGAGVGDTSFFATESLKMAAGLDMEAVAYRGITEAQLDCAAGRIELVVTTLASARALIQAGDLRVLAVSTPERDPALPEVPTVRETGTDYLHDVWFGVFAPANLPGQLPARLHEAASQALAGPTYRRVLATSGALPASLPREAFAEKVRGEVTRFRELAQRAGVANF